ncbi:MAG: translation initiation factor 2 [Firmicutes bacterium]|nr:translation initiation factor 2 [Bacillota bacterium]
MRSENREYDHLVARVSDLEKKVEYLRVSRRVLMNLLIDLEKEKGKEIQRLQEENRRLKKINSRFAKNLWQKNGFQVDGSS